MTTHVAPPAARPFINRVEQDRRTRRVTGWLLTLLAALVVAWLLQASIDPINVDLVIDGEKVFSGTHSGIGERFAVIAIAAAVAFAVLLGIGLVLPVLLAALAIVVLTVVAVVALSVLGVPLLVVAAVALLLSPFLLAGWLLWKLVAG